MFHTQIVRKLWLEQRTLLSQYWDGLHTCSFSSSAQAAADMKNASTAQCEELLENEPEEVVNDHFLFTVALDALSHYSKFWQFIQSSQFSASWSTLQDLQDALRTLFRFAKQSNIIAIRFIERQCEHLESLYPYRVFASVEAVYDSLECSICGRDLADPDCAHLPGDLYYGKVACGIVRDVRQLLAVSLVENPMDKRCIVSFPDEAAHFPLVDYLRSLVEEGTLEPLCFQRVEKKTLLLSASDLKGLGRNAPCPCGSGLKFKKCCLPKGGVERPHFDIIGASAPFFDAETLILLTPEAVNEQHPTSWMQATADCRA